MDAQGFEVTQYSKDAERLDKKHSVIHEIVTSKVSTVPSANVRVAFTGNMMKLSYHCYEMHLPSRMQRVQDESNTTLREMVKVIKKEFKSRTGDTLALKEMREMENYSVQKVSLNERYMYVAWRFFELG